MVSALLVLAAAPGTLTSFLDRDAIRRAIGKSRVVTLGELTHGDAQSFKVKVDLTRFLHREMGFDVLIWESGLYDCEEMNKEIGGTRSIYEVARMGVFSHWSRGAESFPIFDYARETHRTKRPLQMAGFDLQPSGRASDSQFAEMTDVWFKDRPELTDEDRAAVRATFKAVTDASSPADSQQAMVKVYETSKLFLAAIAKNPKAYEGPEWRFRRQVLKSAEAYAPMLQSFLKGNDFFTGYNLRERVNADNLIYLVNERYRGKKVVVWAHNSHLFRGVPAVAAGVNVSPGTNQTESMGRLVSKRLGKQVYSMGVVARSGSWAWLGNPPIRFAPVAVDSLENRLARFGLQEGFIDLRGLPAGHEFRKPWAATINQQQPLAMKIKWPEAFDGLIYIDKMTPRTELGVR